VLLAAASSNNDVTSETQSECHAVSTETGGAGEVSVEAVAPSAQADCQPLFTEAERGIGLCRSVDNSCDGVPDAGTDGLSSLHSAFTSTSSSAAVERINDVDEDESDDGRCLVADVHCDDADTRVYAGDVVSCSIADSPAVVAVSPCNDELISPAYITDSEDSHDVAVTHDVMSHLDLSSILAESFVSTTDSAASVISTEATIGSPLLACDTSSSDLRSLTAGNYPILLSRLL